MKKIKIAAVLIFTMGIFFTSCNETKKEETKEVVNVKEQELSKEVAMAAYQCPMKCEGDKTYAEAGTCPTCKMDLKKVEVSNDADKAEESKEENHEEKMDNHDE